VRRATQRGPHWDDPSFQAHYQRKAEEVLTTYRNVVSLANREEHLQNRSLLGLAAHAFWLFGFYEREKLSIPSASQWFKRTYRHKEWLTTSYSETSIAIGTDTVLAPDESPDLMWFEVETVEMLIFSLKGLLKREDLASAYEFFASSQRALKNLAASYALDESFCLFRRLTPLVEQHAREHLYPSPIETEEDFDSIKFTVALIELHALSFIGLLLGFSEGIRDVTATSLARVTRAVKWERPRAIYETGLPRIVVERMEYLREGLEFERAVEGRYISPLWYRQQLLTSSFLEFVEKVTESLTSELERLFGKTLGSLLADGHNILAAPLIERGLEACNKLLYHFGDLKTHCEQFDLLRKAHDIPWPTIDWEAKARSVTAVRERLVVIFAELLPDLAKLPRTKKVPDFFGHAYSVVAEECYVAMVLGNESKFRKLFPLFFNASLDAHAQLIGNPDSKDTMMHVGFSAQPIIDLFEISGYAIIYQELDGKGFWDCAKEVWDAHLGAVPDRVTAVKAFDAFGNYYREMTMFPRDVARTGWDQQLEGILRKRGLLGGMFEDPYSARHLRHEHRSPIIRVLARSGWFFHVAREFFTIVYFDDEIEMGAVRISARLQSRRRDLQRAASDEGQERD
jgi:hypothetical protein